MCGVTTKLRAQIVAKEPRPFANHVVEDEDAVGVRQELDVTAREWVHLVVGAHELNEPWFGQHVRRIGKRRTVTGARRHPRQKVEVEQARLHAEPVVVPPRKEAHGTVVAHDAEVAEIPVDEDRNLRPLVVVHGLQLKQQLVGEARQDTDVFWR